MWKQIENYPNYFVNELGQIKSMPNRTRKTELLLKLKVYKKNHYYMVDLCKDSKVYKRLVHRIVAETFIPNPEKKEQVNHINGIKTDNRVENLEWNTRSENQKHSIRIGLRHTRGEKNSRSKLNKENVLLILNDKRVYKDIANEYNISVPTVADIKRGYSWTHITGLKSIR